MSAVPASPSSPERCSSASATSCGARPSYSSSHVIRPGSTDPLRVAMTSPSSGVKPMVVSTLRPSSTAASDAPAPRWQVTTRWLPGAISAARPAAHAWERPWKHHAVAGGSRNLLECQLAASGPVSASPSPITQATTRSGLSNAAP